MDRMQRTQIYLTTEQKVQLEAVAKSKAVSMADVVRDAVSQYLAENQSDHSLKILQETFGAVKEWQDRDGVEIARQIRARWDRPPIGTDKGGSQK